MNKHIYDILLILGTILFFGCQSEVNYKKQASSSVLIDTLNVEAENYSNASIDTIKVEIDNSSEDTIKYDDDEISAFGTIISIEDGPYPMFYIAIAFPEHEVKRTLGLNIEDIPLDINGLIKLKGKNVNFKYFRETKVDVIDILINGSSIHGENARNVLDLNYRTITGILTEADEASGDLASEIIITNKSGEQIDFEYFVNPSMLVANNKTVTAYYDYRTTETITFLNAAK